ncbi:rhomboid family intramembrane serine protease [Pontiellaceae bacterium B12227]|nr:rhomboid family intramembrane serine protease [Pontiellaceae bacterium B12227]
MFNNEPRNIGSMVGMTPAVKFLLILNVAVFLLEYLFHIPFSEWFALRADWYRTFGIGQLFTYMFIHATPTHLFANMLGLFFIGPTVERAMGAYRFFILYYVSGIIGGLGWSLIANPDGPGCVGASGAVMGMLGAFGALYPNAKLLLWFVIPCRAWMLVLGLAIWELHETITTPFIGGIANAAHLMGGIAGFCYALTLKYPHVIQNLRSKLPGAGKKKSAPKARPGAAPSSLSKEEIDAILDKIGKEGMGALTPREREMLKRATR